MFVNCDREQLLLNQRADTHPSSDRYGGVQMLKLHSVTSEGNCLID
jgi:hypothetical protein